MRLTPPPGWSPKPVPAADRYGMTLMAHVFLRDRAEVGRDLMACCRISEDPAIRRAWLDDYLAFFPETLN